VDGGASLTPEYVVAYQQDPFPSFYDREATTVRIANGELDVVATTLLDSSAESFSDYDVAWTPGRVSVAYLRPSESTTAESVLVVDEDTTSGATCGDSALVGAFRPTSPGMTLGMASLASGGRPGLGEALLAFSYQTAMSAGNVLGQRYDSLFGGSTTDLGGGCGAGGSISPFGHPVVGNGYFQLTLVGADPAATITALNITSPAPPVACGPCIWLPFHSATTHAALNGASQVILAIPCDLPWWARCTRPGSRP